MANFQVRDGYGSVITIQSSTFGTAERQIVGASIIGTFPVTISGNPSISGTVNVNPASVQVLNPVSLLAVNPNPSSVFILNPISVLAVNPNPSSVFVVNPVSLLGVTQSGAWSASLVGTIPGSVVAFQGGAWNQSVSGQVGASIIGTVPVVQSGAVISSISGAVVISQGSVLTIIAPTTAVTSVASSTSNKNLLALNAGRRGATIANLSATSIMVKLGTTASALDYTLLMQDTDYYEVPFNYSGNIDAIASSTAGIIRVTEIT